jgi:hypothetical protein
MANDRTRPWGLLGMVVLAWGVEARLGSLHRDFLDLTSSTWAQSGRAAAGAEAVGSEVLCLGDSPEPARTYG